MQEILFKIVLSGVRLNFLIGTQLQFIEETSSQFVVDGL